MRAILIFLILITFSTSNGQTNYQKFKKFIENRDTSSMRFLLANWDTDKELDPEFYVCAFNYNFLKSKKEIVQINAGKATNSTKEMMNLYDDEGKQAGYISVSPYYDRLYLSKALMYANQGISKFPNRIDIRFGKCHVLQENEDYDSFVAELKTTIDYSIQNHNNWFGE